MSNACNNSNDVSLSCQDIFSKENLCNSELNKESKLIDIQNTLAAGDPSASDEKVTFVYTNLFKDIERKQKARKSNRNIDKILLRERITGKSFADQAAEPPYLEYNAQTEGEKDFRYLENIVNTCGTSAAFFEGKSSGSKYVKKISCRKQWCPVCGGKEGTIHKSRMHSILRRIDVNKYNIRQFVFTIPENIRSKFQSKEQLNQLFKMARLVIEHYFGMPFFDKSGHVKGYKMELPCISYLHIFGDEDEKGNTGIFKPHMNIHILEQKKVKLKMDQSMIDTIRKDWGKKLKKYDDSIDINTVDIHYNFATSPGKVMHKLKYMLRPWNETHYKAANQVVKSLLVKELLGFQYFRYWGALANCKYKDEMKMSDIIEETKDKIDEILIFKNIAEFDFKEWEREGKLEQIDDGFYRIKEKENESNEKEKER